jgi:hypothetical protein
MDRQATNTLWFYDTWMQTNNEVQRFEERERIDIHHIRKMVLYPKSIK